MPVMRSASLGPVLEFMRFLWALDHAVSTRAKKVGTRFGITATQRLVIRIVGQCPGRSAGMISGVLHIHPSTLTPVLQQLVDRGIVRRTTDPGDRRRAVLWLTARGERIDAASASELDERVRVALSRLSPSEMFHARRVLQVIAEALGESDAGARAKRKLRSRRTSKVTRLARPFGPVQLVNDAGRAARSGAGP
jgi:DNA-binding MarR family transcriptional regulator